jgi:hypothetical protein
MSRLVPVALRDRVIASISAEARARDWDHLAQSDKTALLSRWVNSDSIGGLLRPLLGSDAEVRVWITDVALKRRSRTLLPSAEVVSRAALGPAVEVLPGSAGIKPAHCLAGLSGETYYLCWDRVSNVRHLFWAAVSAREDVKGLQGSVVAIIVSVASTTEPSARSRIERIAACCGLELKWLEHV